MKTFWKTGLWLVALALAVVLSENASASGTCTVRTLTARRLANPFPPTEVPRTVKSLEDIVPKVQALFLSEITKLNISSNEKGFLRKRLLTLKIKSKQCGGGGHQAPGSYYKLKHSIEVCDTALQWPELSFVILLAHEMAHSMDLCSMSADFYEVNRQSKPLNFTPPLSNDNNINLRFITAPDTRYMIADDTYKKGEGKRMLDELIRAEKVKKVDGGIPFSRSPLKGIYDCLSNSSGYPKISEGAKCEGSTFTEGGAQIWATKVASAYINANFFNLSKIDLDSLYSAVKVHAKSANMEPDGKEKDFNEMFFKERVIHGALECPGPLVGSCF